MKKSHMFLALILLAALFTASCTQVDIVENTYELRKFSSIAELKDFLKNSQDSGRNYANMGGAQIKVAMDTAAPTAFAESVLSGTDDGYSSTNVQVEGVDEADIVKNDGKYIYVLSGNKISIVDAYPAQDAKLLSSIKVDGSPSEFFINGDKLIVFGNDYKKDRITPQVEAGSSAKAIQDTNLAVIDRIPFPEYAYNYAYAVIYDISDRDDPIEDERLVLSGSYFNSRMIGDTVYLISNEYVYYRNDVVPPCVYSVKGSGITSKCMPAEDVYYFNYPDSYEFSTIMAIDLTDNSHEEKTILKGTSQTMFVSQENIYIAFQKRYPWYEQQWRLLKEVVIPELPADVKEKINKVQGYEISDSSKYNEMQLIIENWLYGLTQAERLKYGEAMKDKMQQAMVRFQKELEQTTVQKISVEGKDISVKASGNVPGVPLNQFSMDEYEGYFRIATTNSQWNTERSANHVYVLGSDMSVVGKLEDLAPGERIYSARFMGDRLYLVTFRNIDPLFVIDLADPAQPSVLGKLKIPGYSDYLHPYDETHIIGIGKETEEDKENDIAWQQGLKLALFDVSDVEHPKELAKYTIGDRGSDSYALHDHKAFLFSKEKSLLVIPVTVAEIDESKYPNGIDSRAYGDYVFQGAYVFRLTVEDGFGLQGKITHVDDPEKFVKSGHYWFDNGENVMRSLYIGNTLYTISLGKIKMNELGTLKPINSVKLDYELPVARLYADFPAELSK